MKKAILFLTILCSLSLFSFANNVAISNVAVSGSNISFTLSWENSWNSTNGVNPLYPKNWDAVWVFLKYQQATDKLWKPLKISSNSADHSVTGGGATLQVDAVSDSLGVFIHRSTSGAGNIVNATVTLKMTAGLPIDTLNFKAFGIEMVYVPQDTFQVGDGNTAATYFTPQTIGATQENSGITSGTLCSTCPAIPAAFPLGYNSFYAMKYEISSEQWVNFLNTLTYDQQAYRTDNAPNSAINTIAYTAGGSTAPLIRIATPGINNTQPAVYGCNLNADANFNTSVDGQTIALSGIGKGDLYAYLDWAALRPMSETEFEKLCRGNQPRVQGEYAWGSTNLGLTIARGNVTNGGQESENINSLAQVNGRAALLQSSVGMVRTGIFASGASGRQIAGAGFYGNMELTGNAFETVVWVDASGATFTGANGDGLLTPLGEENVTGWPSPTSAASTGSGLRGGTTYGYTGVAGYWGYTSYRYATLDASRSYSLGGRGVR